MNKIFITIDNQVNEFIWFVQKGEYCIADGENLPVDEFEVHPADRNVQGTYTLQAYEIGDEVKILMQQRTDDPAVKGKGIYAAMLPEIHRHYGKRIISSSRQHATISGENRVSNMPHIYAGLEEAGLVGYDPGRDVYYYPNE